MAVDYSNQETLSRVQAYLALPLNEKRQPAGLAELAAVYSLASGQPTGSCRQCQYRDYVAVLVAYERQSLRLLHPETMAASAYTLAPGFENEQFVHESFEQVVTADNLTDKGAEFFIKNGFAHAFLKNGKPVGEETATEARPKTPKQQAVAEYTELFGQAPEEKHTEADLRKLIADKRAELDKQD